MTQTTMQRTGSRGRHPRGSLRDSGAGRLIDRAFSVSSLVAALAVLVVLGYIVWSTGRYAWPAFAHQGWSFLTTNDWQPDAGHFGGLAFIYGTVVSSLVAVAIAVPIAVSLGLFITEVAPKWLRAPAVAMVDLLAAVPSVVFGVVGLLLLRQPLQNIYVALAGASANGTSFMTAGIVLAFMIVPIVTSVAREVFATVPDIDKQGALALGATRWEMFRASIFPYSCSGIVGATMLGLGRALGETIAVALVIGGSPQISGDLFTPGDTMAGTIANTFFSENGGIGQRALIGLGVVLFAITVAVNVLARIVVGRAERRLAGAT